MKSSVPKPLMRLATAHTSAVVGNKPQGSQVRSTLPLLASSTSASSSSYSPESYACVPTIPARISNIPLHHNFSTAAAARVCSGYKFNGKLVCDNHHLNYINIYLFIVIHEITSVQGTLALLGGVMLFLGATPTAQSFFPFSRSTPASRMKERLDKHGMFFI